MKIALCLSGLTRDFKTIAPYTYKNLAQPLGADVFIHTWDEATHRTAIEFPDGDFSSNTDLELYLSEIFDPAHLFLVREPQEGGEWNLINTAHHSKEIAPMFYSIYMANELKKQQEERQGFKYDIVIRARMDHFFREPCVLDSEFEEVKANANHIYVAFNGTHRNTRDLPHGFPEGWDLTPAPSGLYDTSSRLEWRYPQLGVEDQFAIGSSESMDIYSHVYPNLAVWPAEGGEILLGKAVFEGGLKPHWSSVRFKGLVKIDDTHSWYRSYYDEDYITLDIVKLERVR